jgi:hypothetical protein
MVTEKEWEGQHGGGSQGCRLKGNWVGIVASGEASESCEIAWLIRKPNALLLSIYTIWVILEKVWHVEWKYKNIS